MNAGTVSACDHFFTRILNLPQAEKASVTKACERLIEELLKPRFLPATRFLPAIRPTTFNDPVDILGKWHGTRYRLIQRCRSGFPENLNEESDAPFARLDWINQDKFDIQWHRHTGEWFCVHRTLTLTLAIKTLKSNGLLHPH